MKGKTARVQMKVALAAILLIFGGLLGPAAWGQSNRGSISGTVVDSIGAVIPGVQVSITAAATGVGYTGATTSDTGHYQLFNLPPGTYGLAFQRAGFKRYDRNGITILVDQDAKLDVKLQVGATTETVTVTSDAPVLDTATATEATTVTSDVIVELPLSIAGGRNAMSFANMAVPTVGGGIVANSLTASTNIMVDGIDADATIQGQQQPPGVEAVQEVQVQTSGIDAESSQTGGGTFQYQLKSGTNKIHGSAYGFLTNEALDANTWENNYWLGYCSKAGAGSSSQCPTDYEKQYRRPNDRLKDWGFSGGGPIWKKHTFIFGSYEHYKQNTMAWSPNGATVPTTQMLSGDFSQLLTYAGIPSINSACTPGVPCPTGQVDAVGNTIYYGAIFDPANPGQVFPGNVIPNGQISALAQKVIKIYQTDYAPTNDNLTNNYWGFGGSSNVVQNLDAKLDHNFSDRNHVSGSINWAKSELTTVGNHTGGYLWQKGSDSGGPFADSQGAPFEFATIHLDHTYTVTPNLMNDLILAYNWAKKSDVTVSPAGSAFGNGSNLFPVINFSGSMGLGQNTIGQGFDDYMRWQQIRLKDAASWVHGRQSMKFGGEYISYGALNSNPGGMTSYSFGSLIGMSQALANTTQLSTNLGFGFANMLLGDSTGASQTVTTGSHTVRHSYDLFASDQINVTKKLTANVSLRWDANGRLHELNGMWSNWDPTATNASWAPLLGAFSYLSKSSQSFEKNEDYKLFSPHVGVAYQLTHNLVLRGAWGLFYVPLGNNAWGGIPYALSGGCFQCFGYDAVPPASSNVVPAFQWDQNAYPGVYSGPVKDPNANIGGWGISYLDPNNLHLGRTQNWNVGVQYGLSKDTVLDIRYMANVGYDLHDGSLYPQNYPTWSQYQPLLQSGHAGDWITNQGAAAAAGVTWYPFLPQTQGGWGGYSAYAAITQFPQVTAWGPLLVAGYPHGSSSFNGLVAEIKKRAGNSLSMDMSYTFSHAEQNVSSYFNSTNGGNMTEGWVNSSAFQDPYSYNQFKHLVSPNDIRHQVKGYMSYNLPFGKNGRWLAGSRKLNYAVGGWTASGDVNYQSGPPMAAISSTYWYPGWSHSFANVSKTPGALSNHFKKLDLANLADVSNQFFNPASFSNPTYGQLGNQQPFNSKWRGWANYNEDLAVVKHFGFGSEDHPFNASIRAEFFDVLNRHHWGAPATGSLDTPNFGQVTSAWGNRTAQVGARLAW